VSATGLEKRYRVIQPKTFGTRMNTDQGLKGNAHVTQAVIGAAFDVANALGCGFLEKVYENAMAVELRRNDHLVEQQRDMEVWYKGEQVGFYQADLIVDGSVVVELKAVAALERAHRAQCLNYLRATRMQTGLVINFGRPRLEIQRVVSTANP
jgi:GxxExxY protein